MKKILITGGAGFMASDVAKYYIEKVLDVIILDNLSRPGVEHNLEWSKTIGNFKFVKTDIRGYSNLEKIFEENRGIDVIFHEVAQVAVTISVKNPKDDFETNVLGTFSFRSFKKKNLNQF